MFEGIIMLSKRPKMGGAVMVAKSVIGLDFGSDSVRSVLVDAETGKEVASCVSEYKQWGEGRFCRPEQHQYRQHPRDILNSLTECIVGLQKEVGVYDLSSVCAIGVDTTGSTPIAVDGDGVALSMHDEFADNPNAMFVLWKDHTAIAEAEEITEAAHNWKVDYTRYVGGTYSAEWFWAKLLHILREDSAVGSKIHNVVEMCDWVPAVLTDTIAPGVIRRSRCAAGHKVIWHESWGGLPDDAFFVSIDPLLGGFRDRVGQDSFTSDIAAGNLTAEWASRLGLPAGIPVAVGAFDCHLGAIGAGVADGILVKVIGTSTCDIMVAEKSAIGDKAIAGICGQVDGSVLPGMIGLEAGQSAFGDCYAWYSQILAWPLGLLSDRAAAQQAEDEILQRLGDSLLDYPLAVGKPIATDWINGRRTPNANQRLTGTLDQINLGSDAIDLYHAIVEATAFGAHAINQCFESQDVPIQSVYAIGGIPKKSSGVMQICADVQNKPLAVIESEQCCALGAAICAAVAAGVYADVPTAQKAMASPIEHTYMPRPDKVDLYAQRYQRYLELGRFTEDRVARESANDAG
jgi:L-ribulokinase